MEAAPTSIKGIGVEGLEAETSGKGESFKSKPIGKRRKYVLNKK